MIIIGEKLNSSIPSALKAFTHTDNSAIIELIKSQSDNGADYIDINTAMLGDDEENMMLETVMLVMENSDKGIMLDSVNMNIIRNVLPYIKNRPVIINSISLSTDTLPLQDLDLSGIGVVAMPTNEDGIPETPEKRLINIHMLIDNLLTLGFLEENIYCDILIETTAVNQEAALIAIDTLKLIKKQLPDIKTICGASNISYGLPKRKHINCAFIPMAIYNGLDSLIVDINNVDIKGAILSSEMLLGRDEYCMNYIDSFR